MRTRRRPQDGHATFLFTDICGSTNLAVGMGRVWFPETLTGPFEALQQRVVTANAGVIVNDTDDGMLAGFGDSAKALAAAVAIQENLRDDPILVAGGPEPQSVAIRIAVSFDTLRRFREKNGPTAI